MEKRELERSEEREKRNDVNMFTHVCKKRTKSFLENKLNEEHRNIALRAELQGSTFGYITLI
jgi:hypothetical protein